MMFDVCVRCVQRTLCLWSHRTRAWLTQAKTHRYSWPRTILLHHHTSRHWRLSTLLTR